MATVTQHQADEIARRVRLEIVKTWESLGMVGDPPKIGYGLVALVLKHYEEVCNADG